MMSNSVREEPCIIDEELEPVFLAKWKWIDILRPQHRMSWKEARLTLNALIFDTILACHDLFIHPFVVNLIIEYCGNIRDNVTIRLMVYVSARAADRRDMWINAIRFPRPWYKAREVESAMVCPIRTAQVLCCCPYIHAAVIFTLWWFLFGLYALVVSYCISFLQIWWLLEGLFTGTKDAIEILAWLADIIFAPIYCFMWTFCSFIPLCLIIAECANGPDVVDDYIYKWSRLWNEATLMALERKEHLSTTLLIINGHIKE